ncbi:C1q-related factor-like [Saccostrea cucullata]|uniref:C1q-related factor-like n=1 Tax=Saccostrea cuccullata TaxID=36930 RepID=UPI002ED55D49
MIFVAVATGLPGTGGGGVLNSPKNIFDARMALSLLHLTNGSRVVETARILAVQPIAFYAYMSGNLKNPGGHHILIFDTVKTNLGNGYHPHIGVFIVPKSGTYFFTWTMYHEESSYHSTELVVNTVVHGMIYAHTNSGEQDTATGNLILTVNAGDEVYIRTKENLNLGVILSDAYGRTDFSGFLIQ